MRGLLGSLRRGRSADAWLPARRVATLLALAGPLGMQLANTPWGASPVSVIANKQLH